jgi:cysteine desulfuration protein SufE
MTPAERQQQLIETFAVIEDRQERLAAIVDRARTVPRLTGAERVDANLVPGCSSRVWLIGSCPEGRCRFRYDCDSPLVKGLVSVLVDTYDGATPAEIVATKPTALNELGLLHGLSPTRQNGLLEVRRRIVEIASSGGLTVDAASPFSGKG